MPESIPKFTIREATKNDILALGRLHATAWNETYGRHYLIPDYQLRVNQWTEQFKKENGSWFCFVIENENTELIGFAKAQDYKQPDLPEFEGELNKIYILQKYHRHGLGKKLVKIIAARFLEKNIHNMVLFSEPENPACKFYEEMGAEKIISTNGEFHGGYCWRDLNRLLKQ
jgi:ribosomal protein S18 acetylase RimI-like enzyme